MRTILAALFLILATTFAAAQNQVTVYPTGCVYQKEFGLYNASVGYGNSALFLTSVQQEQNGPVLMVQNDGSIQVNMFGGQVGLIGLMRGVTSLNNLNANSGSENSIAFTANNIQNSQLQNGQVYWLTSTSGTSGSANLAVQVVSTKNAIGGVTLDIVSFGQNVAGRYSNGCFSVQSSYKVTGKCSSNGMVPYTSSCQL